jgi:hypothetical protein
VDDAWEIQNIRRLRNVAGTGLSIQLHRKLLQPFEATLREALSRSPGYLLRLVGGYVPRHQLHNPALPLSVHSWGAAVDFNWDTNTIGVNAKRDLPDSFIQAFKDAGWTWGGEWKNHDMMHFQYATGV